MPFSSELDVGVLELGNQAMAAGKYTEIPNPNTGYYKWEEEDELIEAIKSGDIHGFSMTNNLFGTGPWIMAVRFEDESLGERVAEATLRGFDTSST